MGCDIHMYVEYKKEIKKTEQWISGDYFKMNPYFGEFEGEPKMNVIELHGSRNYDLFSLLAGVRDYTQKVVPVSDPKGVPEDACEFVKEECEKWDGDGHNHSWLTLKEIREYQSKSPLNKYTGLISVEDAVNLEKGIFPEVWCQGSSDKTLVRREWEQPSTDLVPLIEKMQQRAKELLQYDWQEYEVANDEKIRIVFWFDN